MKLYWDKKKHKLLKKFSSLKESDLKFKLGKEKEMIMKLRKRLGRSDKDILKIIIDL